MEDPPRPVPVGSPPVSSREHHSVSLRRTPRKAVAADRNEALTLYDKVRNDPVKDGTVIITFPRELFKVTTSSCSVICVEFDTEFAARC